MNSNNEEPWITMNDFVEITDTGNKVEEKKEPEKQEPEEQEPKKQEPEKKQSVKKKKPSIGYDKALEEFFKAKKMYDDAYSRTKKKYLKNRKLTLEQKKAKIKAIKRKCILQIQMDYIKDGVWQQNPVILILKLNEVIICLCQRF